MTRYNKMVLVKNEKQLENLGRRLAKSLDLRSSSTIFALEGELGAGKTTFARGFAKGLGIKSRIVSPTFILARRYKIPPNKSQTASYLWHIDAYRLRGEKELSGIGFYDIVSGVENVVLIEWADRIKKALPKDAKWIIFKHHPHGRLVFFRSP